MWLRPYAACRKWADSQPQGANTGMLLNVLRQAGYHLDYVLVVGGAHACRGLLLLLSCRAACASVMDALPAPRTLLQSGQITEPRPRCPPTAGKQMSYDAGDLTTTGYNPVEAIQAYCAYFPCNRVLAGVQVPPEVRAGRGERGWAAGFVALLRGLAQHIGLSACQSARPAAASGQLLAPDARR